MTTFTPEAIEAAYFVLKKRGMGGHEYDTHDECIETVSRALTAADAAMWRPIDECNPGHETWLVESASGVVGEAAYHTDYKGWWWVGSHPTDYHDGQVDNPLRFRPMPAPPAMIAARPKDKG
jgi:hypothetical protein